MDSKDNSRARPRPSLPNTARAEGGVRRTGRIQSWSAPTLKTVYAWHAYTYCPSCRRGKSRKTCFCRACYYSLPQPMRNKLFGGPLEGLEWEEAYWNALGKLREIGVAK